MAYGQVEGKIIFPDHEVWENWEHSSIFIIVNDNLDEVGDQTFHQSDSIQ
jgi:hypothetical protein